jgi:lysozyme family protein
MTDLIDQMIFDVLSREGGYSNRATDAGGPTKYGITLATLHAWRKCPVSAYDVQQLTTEEAARIYRANYFPAGYESIPDAAVLELLFDFGVNSGVGAAVEALQTVLKHMGLYGGEIDGSFGPQSSAALAKVKNWPALFYAVKCERYELLLRFVGRRPEQAEYAIGWANRNDQFEESFA